MRLGEAVVHWPIYEHRINQPSLHTHTQGSTNMSALSWCVASTSLISLLKLLKPGTNNTHSTEGNQQIMGLMYGDAKLVREETVAFIL